MGGRLILFGVGSALVVDFEESCVRLGIAVAAGIQNREGEAYLLNRAVLRQVSGLDADLLNLPFLCPLFTPVNRWTAANEALSMGLVESDPLLDPTAVIASSTTIGLGSYVNAGCIVGAAGKIGRQVIVNRGCSLGHHVFIGDFASVGPGVVVAGQVQIGTGALIGAGAVVLPKVRIGAFSVVGAGSVVTRDVPDRTLVMGTPARVVKSALGEFGS